MNGPTPTPPTGRTSWATRLMMRLMGRGDEASCVETAHHLQAYLDGHTTSEQVRRISKHLEHCRRCGLEHRTYSEIKLALSRQDQAPDSEAVHRLTAFGQALLHHGDDVPGDPTSSAE